VNILHCDSRNYGFGVEFGFEEYVAAAAAVDEPAKRMG